MKRKRRKRSLIRIHSQKLESGLRLTLLILKLIHVLWLVYF